MLSKLADTVCGCAELCLLIICICIYLGYHVW